MGDIDASLLNAEVEITAALAVQAALALVAAVLAYLAARPRAARWAGGGFVLALVLAGSACGVAIHRAMVAEDTVRRRLEGSTPGPFLSRERAGNHLNWVANRRRVGIGLAVVTLLGSGTAFALGRRGAVR